VSIIKLLMLSVKIGFMAYGGGNTAIVLYHRYLVEEMGLIPEEEFSQMIGAAIFVPGPSAMNIAYATGLYLGGIPGAIVSMIGVISPTILLIIPLWFLVRHTDPKLTEGLRLGLKVVGATMALYASLIILGQILKLDGIRMLLVGIGLIVILALGAPLMPTIIGFLIALGAVSFVLQHSGR
jgi:chromate transporter